MAATRSQTSLFSGQTTTATSSAVDCSTDYAREAYVAITQTGTASSPATFYFQFSADGTNYTYLSPTYSAGIAAATYYWQIPLPVGFKKVKMTYTQQSGGTSSSCTADLNEVTGV